MTLSWWRLELASLPELEESLIWKLNTLGIPRVAVRHRPEAPDQRQLVAWLPEADWPEPERQQLEQALAPLAELADLEFVSLQKGHGTDQWPGPFAARHVAGQAAVTASYSFLDTAAVLANCDLLISADSAVVHLVGALALLAWVLLKAMPEWRWGLAGDRSYWYDSMRLLRQTQPGSWRQPLEQISARLQVVRPGPDAASRTGSDGSPPSALSN